jgi:urease accessory protein
LSLHFQQNRVSVVRQDPPWKVVRAFAQPNASVLVHLNNVSGGVLAGDRLALQGDIDAGASAQITTTGATRLYRHRPGARDSEQTTIFRVCEGARLEYLPDPVIPYAGSRHSQTTTIQLAPGASAFWWEVLAPGRQASGETFAFERLHVRSEICAGDKPLLRESFLLEPKKRPLAVTARMGKHSYMASLYVCESGRPPDFWRGLEDSLNQTAQERTRSGEAVWGASTLQSDGVMVRGLSTSYRFVTPALLEFWRLARKAMTGEEAVPPRKVY